MNLIRLFVLFAILVTVTVTLAIQALLPARWVHAYGVVSPCGLYGVIVVYSDGTSTLHTGENPAPPALDSAIAAAPQDRRTGIPVPCPQPLQGLSQREASR